MEKSFFQNLRKYFPSKKFLIIIGSCILLGGVIFLSSFVIGRKKEIKNLAELQNINSQQMLQDLDTDNDGLPDWEEALWLMDKNNPDTNGDGVLDGQEVLLKRKEIQNVYNLNSLKDEKLSETDKVARQLLTLALNIQSQTGENISEQEIAKLAENFISDFEIQPLTVFKESDIVVSTIVSPKEYYNAMKIALAPIQNEQSKQDLLIFEKAITLNQEKILNDMGPIINNYYKASENLKKVVVPKEIASTHILYMNAVLQRSVALLSVSEYFNDSVVAFRGVQEYFLSQTIMEEVYTSFQNYFVKYGIIQ